MPVSFEIAFIATGRFLVFPGFWKRSRAKGDERAAHKQCTHMTCKHLLCKKKKSQVEICISVSFTSGGKTPSRWAARNLPFTTLGDMVSRKSRQLTARKAVVVNIQDKSFDSIPDNMMKLSLNKQNRLVCQLGPALFFFRF